jgi:hypothetical protein
MYKDYPVSDKYGGGRGCGVKCWGEVRIGRWKKEERMGEKGRKNSWGKERKVE